jgi:hypothetical protein
MRRSFAWSLAVVLCAVPALRAAEPQGKVVKETWEAAYLEGVKSGYSHTLVRELERDGQTFLRTTMELDLSIQRYKATARLRVETADDETPDGKVLTVVLRQFQGKDQLVLLTGVVEGRQLHIKTADGKLDTKIPWDDRVVGLYRQERLFAEHKVHPGDTFSYLSYEPTITSIVTVRVTARDPEEVEVLGKKRKLLRVQAVPDKVTGPQGAIPLPSMVSWLDDDLQPVRNDTEIPGIGKISLVRTTREVALAAGTGAAPRTTDIGFKSLVPLNRPISRPYDTRSVVYRVTVKGDDDPATTFARDERQTISNVHGDTFDVKVTAVREPRHADDAAKPGPEFLKSCLYVNSDDDRVKEYARRAVGQEQDPWRKAQRIERWVYNNVEHDNSAPFTTADKVAVNLRGDCRHKAMLAAAMCRAAGVPSRTAVGLVYANEHDRGPFMAFHMWTEVWVDGGWVAIDGTIGRGSVGADHLKIADHSWYDTPSETPLLPLARVLGKLSIAVVQVKGEE